MYYTSDFRKGLRIEMDGIPFEIIEFQHSKVAMRGGMVRTKLRNLLTGRIHENTFRSGDKVERPDMEMREMQYLYREGTDMIFMDLTSYEQMPIKAEAMGGKDGYLKESQMVQVLMYNGAPMDIELPVSLVFEVRETEPAVKGDTVSNVTKPATLETGLVVQVPIFVNTGDRIKVDTRNGEYLNRE